MRRLRVGVLVSGNGSNLQALLDAARLPDYPAEIVLVVSNVPSAYALERARSAGVPAKVLEPRAFESREAFDAALARELTSAGVELVCLAGFMRLLSPAFLRAMDGKVMNIHPSLLPAFPGLHAPQQALDYGVKVAGCTVHWVDEGTDTGPIIAQAAVPVLPDDDVARLSARIQEQEHRLYPLAVRLVARGETLLSGRRVQVQSTAVTEGLALRNPGV